MKFSPDFGKDVQVFSFYALAVTMPVAETPMHIAFIFFVLGSVFTLYRQPTGHRDIIEYLLLGMALTTVLSTVINWPLANGIKGLRNNLTLYFLCWGCYRANFNRQQMKRFCWCLVVGALVGLAFGWLKWMQGKIPNLELLSAGVVTQSSIYLAIICFVMVGIVIDASPLFSLREKMVAGVCFIGAFISLIVMGSRGAVLASLITSALIVCFHWQAKPIRYLLIFGVVCLALLVSLSFLIEVPSFEAITVMSVPERLFYAPLNRVQHLMSNFSFSSGDANDMTRYENWRIGLAQIQQTIHPWFGIGPRNYESISIEALQFTSPLTTYPSVWQQLQHAHNLFLTKGCEEGMVGMVLFILFFLRCGVALLVSGISYRNNWWWTAAVGALMVPIIAGSFNSPFYNEFAWLSMILLGVSVGAVTNRQPV